MTWFYDNARRRNTILQRTNANGTSDLHYVLTHNTRSELNWWKGYAGIDAEDNTVSDWPHFNFGYDPIGNRTARSRTDGAGSANALYSSNALNQYDSTPGYVTPAYDADGNLTDDGTYAYTWDGAGRLIRVEPSSPAGGDKRVSYGYDYLGRRVHRRVEAYDSGEEEWEEVEERMYVYHGMQCIEELDANDLTGGGPRIVKTFAWGLDVAGNLDMADSPFLSMRGAGGVGGLLATCYAGPSMDFVFFHAYDGNGNTMRLVHKESGGVPSSYSYGPYGETRTATENASGMGFINHYRFSTKFAETALSAVDGNLTLENDAVDLYDYGFRWYHARLGRWTARDPIGERGGLNPYRFVANRPAGSADGLGLMVKSVQCTCEEEPCYCGPDMTTFFRMLVIDALIFRTNSGRVSRYDYLMWLLVHGNELDWKSTDGAYKLTTARDGVDCPSKGGTCGNTYWLCGECVHDRWIGNFMYALLGGLFSIPDWFIDRGGDWTQRIASKDYEDPPWDTASYRIARMLIDITDEGVIYWGMSDGVFCTVLKSDDSLWRQANDTSATPPAGRTYPPPPVVGHSINCKRCPGQLPWSVSRSLPGGGLGSSWPRIK